MIKILVADDSDDNRDILHDLFDGEGFLTVFAANAGDAVVTAHAELPDVVLMDLQMPRTSTSTELVDDAGLEAARQLSSEPNTAHIPIVALSGHNDVERGAAIMAAGCRAIAAKPYDFTALLELIRRLAGVA